MKTETPIIPVSDKTEMLLFVALPEKLPAPGLLVLPEAFGVNEHIRDVAERLAREGYVAAAPELYHRTAPRGFEGSYEDFTAIRPHLEAVTKETLEADLRATYEWLKKHSSVIPDRIGSIGFCLGGRATFLANAVLPLRAAISFYGGRIAPDYVDMASQQNGPLLLVWGGKDEHIGHQAPQQIAEALRAAKKSYTDITFGDADHGFFCDARASYHPQAAHQAWALTLAFLQDHLRG